MKPYFSIIIPLYNKEKHIIDTLNSVWSQSVSGFEVIVVNDGSTDGSLDQVNAVNDERLHIFSIKNQGVSNARNYGISKANADLIVFLDADDVWFEHHLKDLKDLHEEFPNCGMYCKAYDKKDGSILIPSKFKNIPNDRLWKGIVNDYFDSSLINSIAWTSAVMVPKNIFEKIGNFNIIYNSGEDTDLWIRIGLKFSIAFSNKVSAIHNLSSENKITDLKLSSRNHLDFNMFQKEESLNNGLKKYLDLNRYSLAIQYKLEHNILEAKNIYKQINLDNLTSLQKFIFSLPASAIRPILKSRNSLRQLGLNLRLFR
ncbi:glycosyltransferase family 2 protein [Psychroserpens ponticola]|uniref:Glycosyltransferase n=1 Tax=Psychroserpens ponticola TaxID=2932268 RepID=A0ABY7RV27_9FLAO|nr:glycosyltransferase [Psychroserpens ponticola]WCO00828.1 glycosyltransferase [Psychroserpens ponticola]